MVGDEEAAREAVEAAILSRRSVRGFRPDPVPPTTIERLLALAARAPSGSNIQPWRAHVVIGAALDRLKRRLLAEHDRGVPERREYQYYPRSWRSPYIERRRKLGFDLYGLTGVARGDAAAEARQRGRNFIFFGAPVGLVFTIDRDLEQGSWLDYGMFLGTLMIAARGHGLETCPQASIAGYPEVLRAELGIPEDQLIVCGVALGHADPHEPANRLTTVREPVEAFTRFHEA